MSDLHRNRDVESFLVCFLISAVIHLFFFAALGIKMLVAPAVDQVTADAEPKRLTVESLSSRPRLNVTIGIDNTGGRALAAEADQRDAPRAVPSTTMDSVVSSLDADTKNNQASNVEEETKRAELASDVGSYFATPTKPGYLILMLMISAQGEVVGSEVVQTTLVPQASRSIQQRFDHARFTPAEKAGRPVADTILIRVEID